MMAAKNSIAYVVMSQGQSWTCDSKMITTTTAMLLILGENLGNDKKCSPRRFTQYNQRLKTPEISSQQNSDLNDNADGDESSPATVTNQSFHKSGKQIPGFLSFCHHFRCPVPIPFQLQRSKPLFPPFASDSLAGAQAIHLSSRPLFGLH